MNEQTVLNELTKELVTTHTVTQVRLLKLIKTEKEAGMNAFMLYNFYAVTASLQLTSQIKATDTFCMNGLGWGKDRFYKAKAILTKEGLIETIQKRDAQGKMEKVYILVHYLKTTPSVSRSLGDPDSGEQVTNALDKKLNALDKNIINNTSLRKEEFGNSSINEGIKTLSSLLGQNPAKERYNRFALKRLYKTYGEERTLKAIRFAFQVREMKYAPQIFNYMDLEEKWPRLEGFARRRVESPNMLNVEDFRHA